jgi:transcriptional regulator with XRE-family HTH domain
MNYNQIKTFKQIGWAIKQARTKKGLSQREFSKLIGIGNEWLCRIENGNANNTSINTMLKIAEYLETDLKIDIYGKSTVDAL